MNKSCGCSRFQGVTNHSHHCHCHDQQQQRHNKNDDCCCAHTLAKQLKKKFDVGDRIAVYENGFVAVGEFVDVKDKEVLVLRNVSKWITTTIIPLPFTTEGIEHDKVFINLCKVNEVAKVDATFPAGIDWLDLTAGVLSQLGGNSSS